MNRGHETSLSYNTRGETQRTVDGRVLGVIQPHLEERVSPLLCNPLHNINSLTHHPVTQTKPTTKTQHANETPIAFCGTSVSRYPPACNRPNCWGLACSSDLSSRRPAFLQTNIDDRYCRAGGVVFVCLCLMSICRLQRFGSGVKRSVKRWSGPEKWALGLRGCFMFGVSQSGRKLCQR